MIAIVVFQCQCQHNAPKTHHETMQVDNVKKSWASLVYLQLVAFLCVKYLNSV